MDASTPRALKPDEPHSSASRKQVRGSALLMMGRGISLILNFGVQVLAVRYLSKLDYGAFAYALSTMDVVTRFSLLGMDKASSRFAAVYHERRDYPRMFGSLVLMMSAVASLGLGTVALAFGFGGVLGSAVVSNPLSLTLLLTLIVLAPVEAMNGLLQSVFAAFAKARFIFFRRFVVGPGLRLVAIVVVMALGGDVKLLAAVYVIAGFVGLLIGVALLSRVFQEAGLLGHFRMSGLRIPAREIFLFSLPVMASDVAFALRTNLVVQMLEFFHGSGSVASFRAVVPVARLNRGVMDSFGFLFIPLMARLLTRDDPRQVNELFWRSTLWVTMLSFPLFAGTFAMAQPVTVLLFGERYADSAGILALVSLGMFSNAVLGLNSGTLKAAGRVRQVLTVDVVIVVLLFGLGWFLIPSYGAIGGAISYVVVSILHTLMYQVALSRVVGVKLMPWRCAKVYIVATLTVLVLCVVQVLWAPPLYVGIPLIGLAWLLVVASGARLLDIGHTFPELLRIPLVSKLVHAIGGNETDSLEKP